MIEQLGSSEQKAVRVERPIFVGWIALLSSLPIQLFLTVWFGGFFGGLLRQATGFGGKEPFIAFGLLAFVGVPLVTVVGKRLNYNRTQYRFYADRLEFEEGFFSQNKKVIAYADIREVSLRKGILQRTCGLGTIYLGTLATGSSTQSNPFQALGFGNVSASGIAVKDVPNPDMAFARVQALIDESKKHQR